MSQSDPMDSQDAEELLAAARLNNQAATQATVSTTATAQRGPANGAERTEQAKMKMGRNNTEGNTENIHIYLYVCIYIYVNIQIYSHVCPYLHICIQVHKHIYLYIYICVYIYIYRYI